jgi:multiple sugar transport system substrate-binding protein
VALVSARLTRRDALKRFGFLAAGFSLAACTPAPTTTSSTPVASAAGALAPTSISATSAPTPTAALQTAPAKGSTQGTIRVWYFPFGNGVEDVYAQIKAQFEQETPGAKVNLELQPWQNRYPKMLAATAANQAPDVMFMTNDALLRFVEANALVPLDDLLPQSTWDGYDKNAIDGVSYRGSRWYLPMDHELPVWLVNKELIGKAGWDPEKPPATWEQLRAFCEQFMAAKLGDGLAPWGYHAGRGTLNDTFYPFLYQAGGRPLTPDGKEPAFNGSEGLAALDFIVELFEKGWSPQDYMTEITTNSQMPWFVGREAISVQLVQNSILDARTSAPTIKRGVSPVISGKEQWGYGPVRSWAISNSSKNRETAAAFLAFLARPDIMAKHCNAFGETPPKSAVAQQAHADDPEIRAVAAEANSAFDEQKHKYGRDLMPLVIPEIQAAIARQKSSKQALDDAASKVRDLFAKG